MNSTDTPPTDDVLIKVGKDGRLIIPRAIVEKQSLKPGDFVAAQSVALTKAQMNRRTWLKWAGAAIGTGVLVGLEYSSQIRHAIENWNFVKELYTEYVDIDRPLLTHLFGAPKESETAIVPACHHPFLGLEPGKLGYDIEVECAGAYVRALFGIPPKIEAVNDIMKIPPGENIAVFGSQISNFVARDVLGDPF